MRYAPIHRYAMNLFDTVWKPAIVMHKGKPLIGRESWRPRSTPLAAPKPVTEGGHFVAHDGKHQ